MTLTCPYTYHPDPLLPDVELELLISVSDEDPDIEVFAVLEAWTSDHKPFPVHNLDMLEVRDAIFTQKHRPRV